MLLLLSEVFHSRGDVFCLSGSGQAVPMLVVNTVIESDESSSFEGR